MSGRPTCRWTWRLTIAGWSACLGLYALLWLASAVGVRWHASRVVPAGLLLLAAGWVAAGRLGDATTEPPREHGPDSSSERRLEATATFLAAGALALFALASLAGWNIHPDWTFHWGPKAMRYAAAGGIDLEYLTRPWNFHIHADYPNLVPSLTAAAGLVAGASAVTPRVGSVVTVLFAALWILALRALADRLAPGREQRAWRLAAWAIGAWTIAAFGIGFRQAAGADLPFGAAVTFAAAALCGPPGRRSDLLVALAAACAASAKIEGVPFAVLLLVLWTIRRWTAGSESKSRVGTLGQVLLRAWTLPATLIAAWAIWNAHHGLFLASNTGAFDPGRLPMVLAACADAAAVRAWHGLPFLLALLPGCLVFRRSRPGAFWAALLLLGQLAFYLVVYLTTPVDVLLLILTSGPRLLYHVVPAALVVLVCSAGCWQTRRA